MMVLQPMSETESAKNVPSATNLLMWQEKAQISKQCKNHSTNT